MTQVEAPKRAAKPRRKVPLSAVLLQLAAMVGIGLLLYPTAANWISSIGHNADISGYVRQVESAPTEERRRLLDAAYAYNQELKPGPLTDPYTTQAQGAELQDDLYLAYEEMLRLSGTNAIGTLSFPRVGIGLPIFHGTSEQVIARGVGHMYGTSLPVGGPSTRSVLTSHSGLPHAELFSPLHKAQVGDTFWISVLGEDHHYRVEAIEVVEPGDTESLKIIEGEDWVTLFTCTPIGINSHRLMLHAIRIPSPEGGGDSVIGGDGMELGFPWWAVWFVLGSAAVGWLLFAPPRKKKSSAPARPASPSAS